MRIQHNINALNAHRQLGINNTAVGKNLEKLSSGYRINRAGDDAAGLAISEKMRGQIRGLDMAARNANDGISLIQTAEGALNETHSILQRMRELAVQSSNGTYEEGVDRVQLNKEVTALKDEIDRIASSTHFNNQKLLNGELGAAGAAAAKPVSTDYQAASALKPAVTAFIGADLGTTLAAAEHGTTLIVGDKQFMFFGDVAKTTAENKALYGDFTAAKDAAAAKGVTLLERSTTSNKDAAALQTTFANTANCPTGFTYKKVVTADAIVADAGGAALNDAYGFVATGSGVAAGNLGQIKITTADGTLTTIAQTTANTRTGKDAVEVNAQKFATAKVDASNLLGVKAEKDGAGAWKNKLTVKSGTGNVDLTVVSKEAYAALSDADKLTNIAEDYTLQDVADKLNATAGFVNDNVTVTGNEMTFTSNVVDQKGADFAATIALTGKAVKAKSAGVTFQIGANGTQDDRVNLKVENQDTKTLGIKDITIAFQDDANAAITSLDAAINSVSSTRADLGALQNRLEHTVANLGTSGENLTAAESRIRDVDMAKEMMEMTKNNILTQAAQSMLAQANTQPQGVLQLLQ